MNAPVTGHRPASQPLAGLLLGLLTALLLLTLALPLLNPVSWLGRAAPLIRPGGSAHRDPQSLQPALQK